MTTTIEIKTEGLEIKGRLTSEYEEVLTPSALSFVAKLHREFNSKRKELLAKRIERQKEIDAGRTPDFLPETKHIRESDWTVAQLPNDLLDRRVEITGPVNRKMIINALNSGANVFMADFEDSNSPTWANCIEGQINLRDAVSGAISYTNPTNGKHYELAEKIATLKVRPRGWHLSEKHMLIDGEPVSASIFDFGLYFFHNAKKLLENNSGPYFYLPKMESHLEARLWNDIFVAAQNEMEIPIGTIKATVLIEHILASFEMDEILYELKDHSAGLNCGRWDYIFSHIKKFKNIPHFFLPDRSQVTMGVHFMSSYSQLVIKTCHKRNVHAMGGMAAQIPIKNDEAANQIAIEKVRLDKEREAHNGHDGTWVAHPGLIQIAKDAFDKVMPQPNQIDNKREDVNVTAADLLKVTEGTITEDGFITNIDVGVQYMEAWLNGNGCVPIYNLMEDAATAEISRTQLWQWIQNDKAQLDDGREITLSLYDQLKPKAIERIKASVGEERYNSGKYDLAIQLFDELILTENLEEFLTLKAYEHI
ncbi:MAG: malate synthase A [Flavobacteriales bacterium]|nr:malate synthase A [Bacteroidales bacterium AH-315-I05]PCJ84467.1 MAG: malate synthase A [Flavobacteriales bacterium]